MAKMIPDEMPVEHSTEGERLVFRHLRHLLSDEFQVYVEPDVRTKRSRATSQPDFVVFGPDFGLLVLEVKDWTISQIVEADTHQLKINFRKNAPASKILNPLRKVRTYCYQVLDQLQGQPILTQQGGPYQGQVCFPFGWAVVFTNITRKQLQDINQLNQLFPKEYTLCRDELSDLWRARDDHKTMHRFAQFLCKFPFDPVTDKQTQMVEYVLSSKWSMAGVKKWLQGHRPDQKQGGQSRTAEATSARDDNGKHRIERVEKPLTPDQVQTVRGVIHPESIIRERNATKKSVPEGWRLPKRARVLEVLTAEQEQQARAIGAGHRIFFGVAGSGKTILLLARAKRLATTNPDARILVLCYNNTLLSFLRKNLEGYENIKVDTFVSWAIRQYNLHESFEGISGEILAKAVAAQNSPASMKYDAILVDEGHDFQPEWFRAVVTALKEKEEGDLLIAIDGSQSLYNRPRNFTWKSMGVKAQGRSRRLADNYRNTRQIFELAWNLTQAPIDVQSDGEINDTHVRVEPAEIKREGEKPKFLDTARYSTQAQAIAEVIASWKTAGYRDADIAIICSRPSTMDKHINRVREILKQQTGCKTKFAFTKTKSNKRSVIQKESIAILSFLSSKGLEFPAVLLVGLEDYTPEGKTSIHSNQFYVGMTRAMHDLVLSWNGDCWLSQRIKEDKWLSDRVQEFDPTVK